MLTFLAWLLLAILAWPLAILALVLYPLVWLLSVPFRLLGLSLRTVFAFLEAMLQLPTRLVRGQAA